MWVAGEGPKPAPVVLPGSLGMPGPGFSAWDQGQVAFGRGEICIRRWCANRKGSRGYGFLWKLGKVFPPGNLGPGFTPVPHTRAHRFSTPCARPGRRAVSARFWNLLAALSDPRWPALRKLGRTSFHHFIGERGHLPPLWPAWLRFPGRSVSVTHCAELPLGKLSLCPRTSRGRWNLSFPRWADKERNVQRLSHGPKGAQPGSGRVGTLTHVREPLVPSV